MEIVLLWLDELDDVVFVITAFWERTRAVCLQVGLLAAVALAGCELTIEQAARWSPALASVACSSVVVWSTGAMLTALMRRMRLRPAPARA
jgi:hypothetical protein